MWLMRDWGGWWLLFSGLFMFLFWGGIIALVIWCITRLAQRSRSATPPTPLDIAKERYARGDITPEQFAQIKKDLS